ncbi:MAG: NAD-dependent deacylase [Saprospiraceae bacterium]|nr:MAG: NAD-dependent deacetylase [Bacteroidetes bacterium OLB9]MCO6462523.1 NAD-dependent deacylase [Saprospiraceae bacterium]MCZ2338233.1 NAD-dependent deacylase [Chitinophagales bacterium]
MQKIAIFTGAGISAESGISTFRDANGLWENYDVNEVANPKGWDKNPALVLDFYNQRRRQLKTVEPNAAHIALKRLEEKYDVTIITQNIDNLHERGGSSRIIHLHGELNKVRSTDFPELIYHWEDDLHLGDKCEEGYQLRPHVVWFGEQPLMLNSAILACIDADIIIIIGTSMNVYPAAGIVSYAKEEAPIYYIDPAPNITSELRFLKNVKIIEKKATEGVPQLVDQLMM